MPLFIPYLNPDFFKKELFIDSRNAYLVTYLRTHKLQSLRAVQYSEVFIRRQYNKAIKLVFFKLTPLVSQTIAVLIIQLKLAKLECELLKKRFYFLRIETQLKHVGHL